MNTPELVEMGSDLGLDRVGVASVEPFADVKESLHDRKRKGQSDRLGFTFTDPERSTDLRESIPWAERLVVGGLAYVPEAGDPGEPMAGTGRIARFSTDDHYRPLGLALASIAEELIAAGYRAEVLIDDNRLVDRAAAQRAGIGWWGKNTMILAAGVGPWMLLGSVATDAPLETTGPDPRSCGTCSACLPACPTGALVAPGVLDARLCIAALLQQRGSLPRDLRPAIEDRIYGCDDCLVACPPGQRILETTTVSAGRVDVVELLAMDNDVLDQTFHRFYVPGRKMRFLRRNILVALGNGRDPVTLEPIAPFLDGDDPMLVEHAIWAVGRIGGPAARAMLESIRPEQLATDECRTELQFALSELDAPMGK